MSGYKEIDADELHAILATGKVVLVDVRSDAEAAGGIIRGAQHIPLSLLPVKMSELVGDEPLVFYCHSGIRSAQACGFMNSNGRDQVFNLRGGILAWGKAGHPLASKS
ncbi:MAG: rhodanese-like domain-containing protein [Nitrosomonadales bacterium]|nr:MAG: rhodanese-like domain-containing protein [Nitrosomonadales bacterium]